MGTIPNLTNRVDPVVEATIRDLYLRMNKQEANSSSLLKNLPKAPSISDIANALRVSGTNPLNVTGLVGLLSQPQNAKVTNVTTTPTPGNPIAQNGTLFTINGQLFYWMNGQAIAVESTATVLYDTHANRLANYSPGSYVTGTLFWETDRTVLYVDNGTAWVYATGTYNNILSNRPTDLISTDAGFEFLVSSYADNILYVWNGTAWVYSLGVYSAATASRPTLSTGDANFLFIDTTKKILEQWNGTAWNTIGGSTNLVLAFTDQTGAYTVQSTDFQVVSTNSGAVAFALPDSTTVPGQIFAIKNSSTSLGALTVNAHAGNNIDGSSAFSFLATEGFIIGSDGTSNWNVLGIVRLSVSGTVLLGYSSGVQLTLTTSYQNVSGASVTLSRTGLWAITAILDVQNGTPTGAAVGQIQINGSPTTPLMAPINPGVGGNAIGTQSWLYTASTTGIVCQLQAKIFTGTVFVNNGAGYSSLVATWIHS